MAALWLAVGVVFLPALPAVQCHLHDFLISQADSQQRAAIDAGYFGTFSSLPAATLDGEKLFPLIALPPMLSLSLSARSSTGDGESIVRLLEAPVQSRAPPSLKL